MLRPDPTFHASPKLAMEAPPEEFACTLLLHGDFSKPDALAVIDVKPGSPTYSQVVHTVTCTCRLFSTAGPRGIATTDGEAARYSLPPALRRPSPDEGKTTT